MEKLTLKRIEKGEHTCPEVLIRLGELIKRSVNKYNYNMAIFSIFTIL